MGDRYKECLTKSIYLAIKKYKFNALNANKTLVIWWAEAKKILRPLIRVKIPNNTWKDKKTNKTFNEKYNFCILFLRINIVRNIT